MTTLFSDNHVYGARPIPGGDAVRMYYGIEWELLSRSPERRRHRRRM